jgi:hypothetical protein
VIAWAAAAWAGEPTADDLVALPDHAARAAALTMALADVRGDRADALGAALQVVAVLPGDLASDALRSWLVAALCEAPEVRRQAEASARAGAPPPSCPGPGVEPGADDVVFETEIVGVALEGGAADPERSAAEEEVRRRAVAVRRAGETWMVVDANGPMTPLAFALRVGDEDAVARIRRADAARWRGVVAVGAGGVVGLALGGAGLGWAADGGGPAAVALGAAGLVGAGVGGAMAFDLSRRARSATGDPSRVWTVEEAEALAERFLLEERERHGL